MKQSKWTSQEIKTLLQRADSAKSRSSAFADHAKCTGRKANSIRNFYYKTIAEQNPNKCHNVAKFNDSEVETLIRAIVLGFSRGNSIRSICMNLAHGEKKIMLRYQNKYRGILSKNPSLIEKVTKELESQGYFVKSPLLNAVCRTKYNTQEKKKPEHTQHPDNVIMMTEKKETLTDTDLNNLFMGLVRLVKKQADSEQINLKNQIENLKIEIQRLKSKSKTKTV